MSSVNVDEGLGCEVGHVSPVLPHQPAMQSQTMSAGVRIVDLQVSQEGAKPQCHQQAHSTDGQWVTMSYFFPTEGIAADKLEGLLRAVMF